MVMQLATKEVNLNQDDEDADDADDADSWARVGRRGGAGEWLAACQGCEARWMAAPACGGGW